MHSLSSAITLDGGTFEVATGTQLFLVLRDAVLADEMTVVCH